MELGKEYADRNGFFVPLELCTLLARELSRLDGNEGLIPGSYMEKAHRAILALNDLRYVIFKFDHELSESDYHALVPVEIIWETHVRANVINHVNGLVEEDIDEKNTRRNPDQE